MLFVPAVPRRAVSSEEWYGETMRATIDQGGRVVVPKDVRERLGLVAGAEVELHEVDGRLEIAPVATPMRLEERDGQWVARTETELPTLTNSQVRRIIESQRR